MLKLLGWDRVRNYDGSMRDWANRDEYAADGRLAVRPALCGAVACG